MSLQQWAAKQGEPHKERTASCVGRSNPFPIEEDFFWHLDLNRLFPKMCGVMLNI